MLPLSSALAFSMFQRAAGRGSSEVGWCIPVCRQSAADCLPLPPGQGSPGAIRPGALASNFPQDQMARSLVEKKKKKKAQGGGGAFYAMGGRRGGEEDDMCK